MQLTPSFAEFADRWRLGKNQTVWTSLVSDLETPVSAMLKLGKNQPYSFLLESIEGGSIRGRYSIIGREPDLIWRCRDGKAEINPDTQNAAENFQPCIGLPLESLKQLLIACKIDEANQPQPMAAGLFGYLGYEMARQMERLPNLQSAGVGVEESILLRPTLLAIFDQIENIFTLVTPVWFDSALSAKTAYAKATERLKRALDDLGNPLPTQPTKPQQAVIADPTVKANLTEQEFIGMVDKAKNYIRAGDIFQIVLSQRFSQPFLLPPFSLYRAIRRLDPSPFLFFFDMKNFSVVGSSPEILVRVRDGKVTVRPIAGTRARGMGNRSDVELAVDLLADPKELAEHLMLLDLGRNDVGRVSKTGTVQITARNTIEYYKHVMHIVSNVEGELDGKFDMLDALAAGFPAGTVSGAPKIRAMEIVAELERDRRGVYAGCIGYFGANGNMDTAIAIRTAVIKDGVMHVQAGAGIVYDSDPEAEYNECKAKARGLLRAAASAVEAG